MINRTTKFKNDKSVGNGKGADFFLPFSLLFLDPFLEDCAKPGFCAGGGLFCVLVTRSSKRFVYASHCCHCFRSKCCLPQYMHWDIKGSLLGGALPDVILGLGAKIDNKVQE